MNWNCYILLLLSVGYLFQIAKNTPLYKISNNLRNAIKFMKCFIKTNFLSSQRNINKEMLHQVHICKKSRSVDRLKSFLHVFFISFPVKRQFAATYSSQHAFVFNMTDTVSSLKLWRRRLFTPLHLFVKCRYILDS